MIRRAAYSVGFALVFAGIAILATIIACLVAFWLFFVVPNAIFGAAQGDAISKLIVSIHAAVTVIAAGALLISFGPNSPQD